VVANSLTELPEPSIQRSALGSTTRAGFIETGFTSTFQISNAARKPTALNLNRRVHQIFPAWSIPRCDARVARQFQLWNTSNDGIRWIWPVCAIEYLALTFLTFGSKDASQYQYPLSTSPCSRTRVARKFLQFI